MRSPAPTLSPDDSIATAARILADTGLSGVPVLEDGVIIGLVTDKDLIQRSAEVSMPTFGSFLDAFWVADAGRDFDQDLRHVLATTARQLMTHPGINIRDIATLDETATVMMDRNVSTLPVLDAAGTLIGIVTRQDLVRVIARLEGGSASA